MSTIQGIPLEVWRDYWDTPEERRYAALCSHWSRRYERLAFPLPDDFAEQVKEAAAACDAIRLERGLPPTGFDYETVRAECERTRAWQAENLTPTPDATMTG